MGSGLFVCASARSLICGCNLRMNNGHGEMPMAV